MNNWKKMIRNFLNKALLILSFVGMISSCSNEINSNIAEIKYGTSFGECIGYCKRQITVKADSVKYNCSSWDASVLPVTYNEKLTAQAWDSIRTSINVKSFLGLQEVIGCPDCADGGAEWLQLKMNNGDVHKVTFEYRNEPQVLKTQVEKCRLLLQKNTCK
jgi:hypothetical protein